MENEEIRRVAENGTQNLCPTKNSDRTISWLLCFLSFEGQLVLGIELHWDSPKLKLFNFILQL